MDQLSYMRRESSGLHQTSANRGHDSIIVDELISTWSSSKPIGSQVIKLMFQTHVFG